MLVYDDGDYHRVLRQAAETSPYALTGAIIAQDRAAIAEAADVLHFSAGNFHINDKPTGVVVGQRPFGGGRAASHGRRCSRGAVGRSQTGRVGGGSSIIRCLARRACRVCRPANSLSEKNRSRRRLGTSHSRSSALYAIAPKDLRGSRECSRCLLSGGF